MTAMSDGYGTKRDYSEGQLVVIGGTYMMLLVLCCVVFSYTATVCIWIVLTFQYSGLYTYTCSQKQRS